MEKDICYWPTKTRFEKVFLKSFLLSYKRCFLSRNIRFGKSVTEQNKKVLKNLFKIPITKNTKISVKGENQRNILHIRGNLDRDLKLSSFVLFSYNTYFCLSKTVKFKIMKKTLHFSFVNVIIYFSITNFAKYWIWWITPCILPEPDR